MDISLKRILAYVIDIAIITIVVTLFSSISSINPYRQEYNEKVLTYQELMDNTSKDEKKGEEYQEKIIELNYEIGKSNWINGTITILSFILYFGIYNYFSKGQTIGKKIMQLQLVSINAKKKLSFISCFVRTIILNNIIFRVMLIVGVFMLSKNAYFNYSQIISFIESIIETIIFAMVILRKDNRGLHDMIAKTKVISIATSEIVIEEKTLKKSKNTKKK